MNVLFWGVLGLLDPLNVVWPPKGTHSRDSEYVSHCVS